MENVTPDAVTLDQRGQETVEDEQIVIEKVDLDMTWDLAKNRVNVC